MIRRTSSLVGQRIFNTIAPKAIKCVETSVPQEVTPQETPISFFSKEGFIIEGKNTDVPQGNEKKAYDDDIACSQ